MPVNKTSRPRQWIRKDVVHVLYTNTHTHTHTHTQTLREIQVCVTLFKFPASVKLNLGIIISSRPAESHLCAPPPRQTQREELWEETKQQQLSFYRLPACARVTQLAFLWWADCLTLNSADSHFGPTVAV